MTDLHVSESISSPATSKTKPSPKSSAIPVPFSYAASDDGTDENLLILLHGLGDTHAPFFKLGTQFKLPQTAILALRAPELIPYLYEDAYQWYPSFDSLGELIERPNPTPALDIMSKTVQYLTKDCGWPVERIHLFGFAQGGSVALEFGLQWESASQRLGSIVSVNGPLLSYPTRTKPATTPVLIAYRPEADHFAPSALTALKKGYGKVVESKFSGKAAMPSSKEHWEPIMRFWSEHLGRRREEGLYEIMSGMSV